MPPKIIDPREALREARDASGAPGAVEVAGIIKPPPLVTPEAPAIIPGGILSPSYRDRVAEDFRLFIFILWDFLLKAKPQDIQLDIALWLQHGPQRSVTEAFRGFGKSWITGGYGLWRLDRNPQTENVMVVSGGLLRAQATTNWMLTLIMTWDFLKHLQPGPKQRSSSQQFDVGPAKAQQSASVFGMGIGGQTVGFRADCIIADDVETQTNSITVDMREKTSEAVKEFDSVLKPEGAGAVKFLGTPHDAESLYSKMPSRGYGVRIWPALYPNAEEAKRYGDRLAPYVKDRIEKNPALVGTSTMPGRFTNDEFAVRKLSLGSSEFALQFMLDTTMSDRGKYPLRQRDLMVMALDPRKGPEAVAWTNDPAYRVKDLPNLGFEADHFYAPRVGPEVVMVPWTQVKAAIDPSGRGKDETAMAVGAELHGIIYCLDMYANQEGHEPATLQAIADRCVKWGVGELHIEDYAAFIALFTPILTSAWRAENRRRLAAPPGQRRPEGGTEIVVVKRQGQSFKEKRILDVLEPATQSHRLVMNASVYEWDNESLKAKDGEDTRSRYALGYQFTHLTRERDSLPHDDRVEVLSMMVGAFPEALGLDPRERAALSREEAMEAEMEKLDAMDEDRYGLGQGGGGSARPAAVGPQRR